MILCSISCPSSLVIPFLGEFHSDKHRSKMLSWIGTCVIVLPGLSWILSMNWRLCVHLLVITMRLWRLLIIMCSVLVFLATCFLVCNPESQKFIWATDQTKETLDILRSNNNRDASTNPVTIMSVNN